MRAEGSTRTFAAGRQAGASAGCKALLAAWPDHEEWLTEDDVVDVLVAAGHPVIAGADGEPTLHGRRVRSLLNEGRRRSWMMRDRRRDPVAYFATRTGRESGG